MQRLIRIIFPGLLLIGLISSVLLLSDPVLKQQRDAASNGANKSGEAPKWEKKSSTPKKWRIQLISYVESPASEASIEGFKEGLGNEGLLAGRDYDLFISNAQGEMSLLGSLIDSALMKETDLFAVFSTVALQSAIQKVKTIPVVFTYVANPFIAGAGKSETDHLPNVTGVYTMGPYKEMAELLAVQFPGFRRVGTLFCPSEPNSAWNKDTFSTEAAKHGIEVIAVPASSPTELNDAVAALTADRIDAIVQIIDNLSSAAFPAIAQAAENNKIPLFAFESAFVKEGAILSLSRDYQDAGRETAHKAALIMRGESAATIPISPPGRIRKALSINNAAFFGISISDELLRTAVDENGREFSIRKLPSAE